MSRVCPECKMEVRADEPDPCWGELPGVEFACCGHGGTEPAYIAFTNGTTAYFDGYVSATLPRCEVIHDDGYPYVRPFKYLDAS